MYTLSDLVNAYKGTGKALVIYLPTSIGRATSSGQTFERMLGTLGRDLGNSGGVVVSFDGMEDQIAAQVLSKNWTDAERTAVATRPGLLFIDQDFAEFDPRSHDFFHLDLRHLYNDAGTLNEKAAENLLLAFHQIFPSNDIFHLLHDRKVVLKRQAAVRAIKLTPSFYGIGIDVRQLIRAFQI